MDKIEYTDFAKLNLVTAKIISANKIEKSDKLLKLDIEIGESHRQIVAGIGKMYTEDELVGKIVIVLENLVPRTLFGVESQGMLLAVCDEDSSPILLTTQKESKSGLKIQ